MAEVWVVNLKLNRVIGTRCPFALEISHLHDVIVLTHELLVGCIRCGNNDLSSARVASCKVLLETRLTASSDRWLSSGLFMVLLCVTLVCNRMSHRVDVIVGELVLVRDLNISIVVDVWEHAVFQP